jgi:site-specific recombinase XerD
MTNLISVSDIAQHSGQGPLDGIIPAYADLLSQQGFKEQSTRQQLRFLSDMNRWLYKKQLAISDLTAPTFQRYLQSRYRHLRPRRDDAAILNRLEHLLQIHGLLPKNTARVLDNPHQRIDNDFDRYLSEERGLSKATRINYRPFVHKFLSAQFGDNRAHLSDLKANDVIQFIRKQAPQLHPKYAGLMVSALRSFLRFLRLRGDITTDLAACIPPIANWKFSTLPKFLPPEQVQRVLNQCDRDTAKGRRDYAILLLLAQLGLRASEIVTLTLDDIDWQAGQISIQGKAKRVATLPLSAEVGQAIAAYLKNDRPACSIRRVFICMRAPLRGFANSIAISTIVARYLKKAGINAPHTGAHLFRHSLATQMLRQGATLSDIALLLRHRSLNTTTIYAKVDLAALHALAQPWPGGAL